MSSARINLESVFVGLTLGLALWLIGAVAEGSAFQVSTLTRQLPRAVVVVSSVNVAGCCCEGER